MLGRPHGSCVDVHVRIYLNGSDLQSCHLQQKTGGRGYMREFQTQGLRRYAYGHKPMTPFPIPLTTPPETMMYFVMTIGIVSQGREVVSGQRQDASRCEMN